MLSILDPKTYPEELESFRRFCLELTLDNGKPMVLEDFQLRFLAPFFGGTKENFVLIPKGNSKTTTIAALCLYHLLTTPDAECIVVAKTIEQAGTLYKQAEIFAQNSEALSDLIEIRSGTRQFRSKADTGRIWIRASDAGRIDGSIVSLFIIDEGHLFDHDRYPYFALRKGAAKRDGQGFVISTAGDDETSPLGMVRAGAHRLEPVRHPTEAYAFYGSPDGSFAFHEWALDPNTDDIDSIDAALRCNPASWITAEVLRDDHPDHSVTTRPFQWYRYVCNVWHRGEGSIFQGHVWDRYADTTPLPEGTPVRAGLDIGLSNDTTSLMAMTWQDGGERRVIGKPIVFESPADEYALFDRRAVQVAIGVLAGKLTFDRGLFMASLGETNKRADVEAWADVIAAIVPMNLVSLTFDPYGADDLIERVERKYGITCVRFDQKAPSLVRADQLFMEAFQRGQIRHDGDPTLKAHALNAIERRSGNSWFFGHPKERDAKPMDALRAVSMAHDTLVAEGGVEPPKPKRRSTYRI